MKIIDSSINPKPIQKICLIFYHIFLLSQNLDQCDQLDIFLVVFKYKQIVLMEEVMIEQFTQEIFTKEDAKGMTLLRQIPEKSKQALADSPLLSKNYTILQYYFDSGKQYRDKNKISHLNTLKYLEHPNVLRCERFLLAEESFTFITQHCSRGNLQKYINQHGPLSQQQAGLILIDVYCGLCYLAKMNIVHKNLTLGRIFLDRDMAKIGALGSSHRIQHLGFERICFKGVKTGELCEMAPQTLMNDSYCHKSDVWSFGLIYYELLHGKKLFGNRNTKKEQLETLTNYKNYNPFHDKISPRVKSLIERCLLLDESKRPSILQLASEFLRYLNQLYENSGNLEFVQNISKKIAFCENSIQRITQHIQSYDFEIEGGLRRQQVMPSVQLLNNMYRQFISKLIFNPEKNKQFSGQFLQLIEQKSKKMHQENYRDIELISYPFGYKGWIKMGEYVKLIYDFLVLFAKHPSDHLEKHLKILKQWTLDVICEAKRKIGEKYVIFEGNAQLREKALLGYFDRYERKTKEMFQGYERHSTQGFSLNIFLQYCFEIKDEINAKMTHKNSKEEYKLGFLIIFICELTKILGDCYSKNNYHDFQSNRTLDLFKEQKIKKETENKIVVFNYDLEHYVELRRRMKKIRPEIKRQ